MPESIGSGNERGNAGVRVGFCRAHGDLPDHVDMIAPLPDFGMAEKIRVDASERIITHDVEQVPCRLFSLCPFEILYFTWAFFITRRINCA